MTLCGGVCEWRPGGGCRIKLSEPLLKLRPTRDLKDVLLHEMAHAFMMLQGGLAGFWGGLSLQGRGHPASAAQPPAALHALKAARKPGALRLRCTPSSPCPAAGAGIRDNDPGGHGTIFKSIIQRINTSTAPDHQRPPGGCAAQCLPLSLHLARGAALPPRAPCPAPPVPPTCRLLPAGTTYPCIIPCLLRWTTTGRTTGSASAAARWSSVP